MQLLYRINRTGTTVVVATHDLAMVDRMRRRVIELSQGGSCATSPAAATRRATSTTAEFGALLREPTTAQATDDGRC